MLASIRWKKKFDIEPTALPCILSLHSTLSSAAKLMGPLCTDVSTPRNPSTSRKKQKNVCKHQLRYFFLGQVRKPEEPTEIGPKCGANLSPLVHSNFLSVSGRCMHSAETPLSQQASRLGHESLKVASRPSCSLFNCIATSEAMSRRCLAHGRLRVSMDPYSSKPLLVSRMFLPTK